MARQRMLHPGFFTDGELLSLSPLHRLLFAGLWCWADREGRLEDKPIDLKIRILPADNCDVNAMLDDLARAGRVVRYASGGRRYLAIRSFSRYQKPHPREAASHIPAPPSPEDDSREKANLSTASREKEVASRAESESESESESEQKHTSASPPERSLVEDLRAIWNEHAPPELPRWEARSKKRLAAAKARLSERPDLREWFLVVQKIAASSFCRGSRGWRANPDWLLRPDTAAKVLEGQYDDPAPPRPRVTTCAEPGCPEEALEQVYGVDLCPAHAKHTRDFYADRDLSHMSPWAPKAGEAA